MTRKDFAAIAAVLLAERPSNYATPYRDLPDWGKGATDGWHTSVLAFAAMLRTANPRFDAARFLVACGFNQR